MTLGDLKPKRWWQWFLMYPTVAVAMLGLVPGSTELYRIIQTGGEVPMFQTKDAVTQMNLWQKNAQCVEDVDSVEVNATGAVIVGAKICQSGDILISGRVLGGLPAFRWIPVHMILGRDVASTNFFPQAHAETSAINFTDSQSQPGQIICQRWVGNGMLLQRVYWGPTNSCYDNLINTFTGMMVSSTPAPCNKMC
jgi:hypothetical protein